MVLAVLLISVYNLLKYIKFFGGGYFVLQENKYSCGCWSQEIFRSKFGIVGWLGWWLGSQSAAFWLDDTKSSKLELLSFDTILFLTLKYNWCKKRNYFYVSGLQLFFISHFWHLCQLSIIIFIFLFSPFFFESQSDPLRAKNLRLNFSVSRCSSPLRKSAVNMTHSLTTALSSACYTLPLFSHVASSCQHAAALLAAA